MLLDDAVTHFDDLNAYGFIEMIRGIVSTSPTEWQFVISTCEERLFNLFRKKFSSPNAIFYEFKGMSSQWTDRRTRINAESFGRLTAYQSMPPPDQGEDGSRSPISKSEEQSVPSHTNWLPCARLRLVPGVALAEAMRPRAMTSAPKTLMTCAEREGTKLLREGTERAQNSDACTDYQGFRGRLRPCMSL